MPTSSGFGIYIHWPYCTRICPYCDFNIYRARSHPSAPLSQAIVAEMHYWRKRTGPKALTSIHFGGGTPSLIPPNDLKHIIKAATTLWSPKTDIEMGIEANPNDIDEAQIKGWLSAGLNRVSIGVQSFDPQTLQFLGRDHSDVQARKAATLARKWFKNVSADLIFGWRAQSLSAWTKDLNTALELELDHISTYQLTIKPGTAFERAERRGQDKTVGDHDSAKFYEQAVTALTQAGYDHYEVSNFAKTPKYISQHNLLYWSGGEYLGLGPGAHGRVNVTGTRLETLNILRPDDYIAHVTAHGHGGREHNVLSRGEQGLEYVLMGLRARFGISETEYERLTGSPLDPQALDMFISSGHLVRSGHRLRASESGFLLLDTITQKLLGA